MQYHIFVLWVQSVGNLFVSILPPASSYLVTVGTGLVATPLSESPMTIVFKTNSKKKKLRNRLMSTLFQRQNKFKVDTNSLSPSTFKSLCIVLFGYLSSVVETLFKTRLFCIVSKLNVVYSTRPWNAVARAATAVDSSKTSVQRSGGNPIK